MFSYSNTVWLVHLAIFVYIINKRLAAKTKETFIEKFKNDKWQQWQISYNHAGETQLYAVFLESKALCKEAYDWLINVTIDSCK